MKKTAATDLLDALRATVAPTVVPKGWYSIAELSNATGESVNIVKWRVKKLNAERMKFKPPGAYCATWFYRSV